MANKKKSQNSLSPAEQRLEMGISLQRKNPLFSMLKGYLQVLGKKNMGGDAAYVHSGGTIYLNKDAPLTPQQWAYTIAHCKLHLAFGHFDAERMPGYEKAVQDGSTEWVVSCNQALWNMACDIYIAKFLHDIKFGSPTCANPTDYFPVSLTDERKIYQYLMEHGYGTDGMQRTESTANKGGKTAGRQKDEYKTVGGKLQRGDGYGTAAGMDMQGLERPLVYNATRNQKNEFMFNFAFALAYSVSSVVSEAGGHGGENCKNTASEMAAQWFISHYPLLGGLAAGFHIIEDYRLCNQEEISIAAVNVTKGEIYVNPAAGLNKEELKFVLAHEFLHAGLMHHERREGRDPYLWNVACDYVINGWLREMGVGEMPDQGLYDESLKDVSAEELYDRIVRDFRRFSKLDTLRGYGKGDVIIDPKGGMGSVHSGVTSLDDFYRSALQNGLEFHLNEGRGYLPAGLIEEIRALFMPPVPWDVQLGNWFDEFFAPLSKHYTYARPSRRQSSTPNIPRPSYVCAETPEYSRTFGVVIDTSGSMEKRLLGFALGAVASYAQAKEVLYVRVVFCDAKAYDAGYLPPEEIAGRVLVKGGGGTVLQPGVDLLEKSSDFPKDGPILIITDGWIEDHIRIRREHAFLVPRGRRLPFVPRGKVFYFEE